MKSSNIPPSDRDLQNPDLCWSIVTKTGELYGLISIRWVNCTRYAKLFDCNDDVFELPLSAISRYISEYRDNPIWAKK